MRYIGVDMSKKTFHTAFEDGTVKVFDNDKEGILEFMNIMNETGMKKDDVRLGIEATGMYHLMFCDELKKHDWKVYVINPMITSRAIKSSIRRVKNDHKDALTIRKTLMTGEGYLYIETKEIVLLKALLQERWSLVGMAKQCLQWSDVHEYRMKIAETDSPNSFVEMRKTVKKEIQRLEKEMALIMKEEQKLLRTIPGVGKVSAAYLVGYIMDINRFSNPKKLVAYIGLDCRVHESGTSIHGKGYLTKRGNKYLRHILFQAAFIAKRRNPDLKKFFEKKIAEGKHYFKAVCAVERKLIHVIYAVWKRKTPFLPHL